MAYQTVSSIQTLFKASLLLLPFSFSLMPVQAASSGTINFLGRIVEAGCETTYSTNQLTQTCMDGNKSVKQQMTLQAAANGAVIQGKNQPNQVSFRWIDKEKKLGIAEITYN
ncbi:hypothetical protein SOASR030_21510 [Leminorella grimontii]|uniref:Type 1 fimbrial protein n=1 Tax=Leminorella grimontii TaxID=82981 RepID=A0AAV5N4X1_9GAMM|nr:hypothetical protein [Leminorella grimontii]GKX56039.1 hypothetical protein SOASR030_21510 [Leminorella grimontii]GKX59088.1 hypothetical protein SOASR031_14030 [Leminorella grimontii]VFS57764.1 Uncharacterised protein [Leminorella grimontii]